MWRSNPRHLSGIRRAAFTLVEATLSLAVVSLAGAALLVSATSTLQSTDDAVDHFVAQGMAQQLMDEVLSKRYMEPGGDPYQTALTPNATELAGRGRSRYNDIDDYHNYRSQPPTDRWNIPLGTDDNDGSGRHPNFRIPATTFPNWRQEVDVYYVQPNNLRATTNTPTSHRVVRVRIVRVVPGKPNEILAEIKRVVSYVPFS